MDVCREHATLVSKLEELLVAQTRNTERLKATQATVSDIKIAVDRLERNSYRRNGVMQVLSAKLAWIVGIAVFAGTVILDIVIRYLFPLGGR